MSKNQFTGAATQPQRNRKFCQFNNDQYCMTVVLLTWSRTLFTHDGNHPSFTTSPRLMALIVPAEIHLPCSIYIYIYSYEHQPRNILQNNHSYYSLWSCAIAELLKAVLVMNIVWFHRQILNRVKPLKNDRQWKPSSTSNFIISHFNFVVSGNIWFSCMDLTVAF